MNHLLRGLAPISESAWTELDDEARERLGPALAARKLVDFSGPLGWEHSATKPGADQPAAHQIAVAENIAEFHGWNGAITGIGETSPHEQIQLGEAAER